MTVTLFIILLTIIGCWGITDGWFSLSLYLRDKNQTWGRDHYIRIVRIAFGLLAIYLAYVFGRELIG